MVVTVILWCFCEGRSAATGTAAASTTEEQRFGRGGSPTGHHAWEPHRSPQDQDGEGGERREEDAARREEAGGGCWPVRKERNGRATEDRTRNLNR